MPAGRLCQSRAEVDVQSDLGAAVGAVGAHDPPLVDRAIADARDLELAARLHRDGRARDDEVGDGAAERPVGRRLGAVGERLRA